MELKSIPAKTGMRKSNEYINRNDGMRYMKSQMMRSNMQQQIIQFELQSKMM